MTKKDAQDGVKRIFIELFPELRNEKFDFKKKQAAFKEWDSFMHMKLISTIEERFGKALNMEEAMDVDSPQKFVDLLSKK